MFSEKILCFCPYRAHLFPDIYPERCPGLGASGLSARANRPGGIISNVCRNWKRLRERLHFLSQKKVLPCCFFAISLQLKKRRKAALDKAQASLALFSFALSLRQKSEI